MPNRVAILLNAPYLDISIDEECIICADGGFNLLPKHITPYAIVGDLDSIHTHQFPSPVLRCPTEKDYTDGERAIFFAAEQGFNEITIYGATGGRSDHIYANLALLALAQELGLKAKIKNSHEHIYFYTQGQVQIKLPIGTTLSCLPYGEKAIVNNSHGLYYPYHHLALSRSRSVGISNVTTKSTVQFDVLHGAIFVFINHQKTND